MHIAQSFVGKVLSSWAILPPMPPALDQIDPDLELARSSDACTGNPAAHDQRSADSAGLSSAALTIARFPRRALPGRNLSTSLI
jgi:hypothetical protein